MRFLVLPLFLLSLSFISACSNVDNSIPPAELTEFKPSLKLKVKWQQELEGGANPYHAIEPAVYGKHVFTVSAKGLVSKIDIETGFIIWQNFLNIKLLSGLAVSEFYIVLASREGNIQVLKNQQNLDLVWQTAIKSEINVSPVINKQSLYIRSNNGHLQSYDMATGDKLWDISQRVPALSITGSAKPVVIDDKVFNGFDNGVIRSVDSSSGETLWEKAISIASGRSELDRMVDVDGESAIQNGIIYASNYNGYLKAFQTQDGTELWSRPMSNVKLIAIDEQALYISDHESTLWSIDRKNGSALWKQELLHHRDLTSVAIIEDVLVVGDFEGYSHWISKQTGELKARLKLSDEKILNTPLVVNDYVLFLDTNNTLSALKLAK